MSDGVVEVETSVGRSFEPQESHGYEQRDATVGEQILADTIAEFDGPIFEEDDAMDGESDESATAFAQAHVFRILTDYSYNKLERVLKGSRYLRERLGFESVPDRSTFSYGWRDNMFREPTRKYLKAYATWIQDELADLDCREVEAYLPTEEEEHESWPEMPQGAIDESVEHVRDIMLGTTDFDRGHGTEYPDSELLDIMLDASREGAEIHPTVTDNDHDPALKTLLNALKNREGDEWQDEFLEVNDRVLSAAKRSGMLDRPVTGDLDVTVIPFYPQEKDPTNDSRKGEKKKGTIHGFHFATMTAYDKDHGKCFVVAQTPYTPDMKPLDLVEELVDQARDHCHLESLTLDSAFSGTDVISFLKEEGIDFITRLKRKGSDLKGVLAQMTKTHDDFENFTKQSSDGSISEEVRVVSEPDWKHATKELLARPVETTQTSLENFDEKGDPRIPPIDDLPAGMWKSRRPYATNIEDMDPSAVIRRYKYRWRVENSYADKKRALLGKTQSRHHGVRVFIFWLTVLLYNGWQLLRAFLRLDFPGHAPRDRPPITARQFMKSILGIPYG